MSMKTLSLSELSARAPQRLLWSCAFVLTFLGLGTQADAAIAYVQSNASAPASASTMTVTYTSAQSAGDLNVVAIGWVDSTSNVASVTDSKGNTYVRALGPTTVSGTASQSIYYALNIAVAAAGANTVTVTFNATVPDPDVRILEYSGIATANALDVAVGASSATGTALSSGTATTTNANDLILGSNVVAFGITAAGSGYTQRIISAGNTEEDEIVSSTGSYSATATQSPSGWWIMQLTAFKAAGPAPSAPTSLAATATSATQVNLTWTASTAGTGGAVNGYRVERCSGASCTSFTQIATPTTTSFSDTTVAPSTSYSYRVRASDAAGDLSGYSSTSTVSTPADTTAPSAPSGLTASVISSSQINLSWSASTDNVGVAGYVLQRCSGSSCTSFAQIATPTTTSFSDTALTASTTYSYRVEAKDAAGNASAWSGTATATTQSSGSSSGGSSSGGSGAATASYKQSGSSASPTSGGSLTATYSSAQTAGDLNVVAVGWVDATSSVTSVTDSKGNTYIRAVGPTIASGTATQSIYYAQNIVAAAAGANIVTVTFSTTVPDPVVRIVEYSGIATSNALDVAVGASSTTGTALNSGSVTTTNANDLLVGSDVVAFGITAAGSGYTQRVLSAGNTEEDEIVTSAGSYSASATQSPSGWWIMQLTAFKAASTSINGTTIPSASFIVDGGGNVWTVSGGVIYENGNASVGTANVILLLYYNGTIYQENSSGSWFLWNGSGWTAGSGDPRGTASASGTTIPSATQLVDSAMNVWAVSGGVIYKNGIASAGTANVILLLYYNGTIYQENSSGSWFSWNGSGWTAGSGDPRVSASGTTIPLASQIVDSAGNVWTVSGGVIYENGATAGFSANVILLLYYNGTIYQENSSDSWFSWNGSGWTAVSGDPRVSASGTTIPSANQLVDSAGNVWTVSGGVIYENGNASVGTANVILLLYYNGTIYQENSSDSWFSWNGSSWVSIAGDPRNGGLPGVRVGSGGQLVSTSTGSRVVLIGNMVSGVFFGPLQQTNVWTGASAVTSAQWAAGIAQWADSLPAGVARSKGQINTLRLSISSVDYMGYTGIDPYNNSGQAAGAYYTVGQDANGRTVYSSAASCSGNLACLGSGPGNEVAGDPTPYRNVVDTIISNWLGASSILGYPLYVILDDHFSSVQWTPTGQIMMPMDQPATLGAADIPFYQAIAAKYGNRPEILLELFNELYGTTVQTDTEDAWLGSGHGTPSTFTFPTATTSPSGTGGGYRMAISCSPTCYAMGGGQTAQVISWQQALNAYRAAGGTNVVIVGTGVATSRLASWSYNGGAQTVVDQYMIGGIRQMAAAYHAYNQFESTDQADAIVAAGVPFIGTEGGSFTAVGGNVNASPGFSYARYQSNYSGWSWCAWATFNGNADIYTNDGNNPFVPNYNFTIQGESPWYNFNVPHIANSAFNDGSDTTQTPSASN
jgi:hypothetical protein